MTLTLQEELDAENHAKSVRKKTRPPRGRMSFKRKLAFIIFSLMLMAVMRTGFLFIIIGLLPSIVAYYMDISTKHYSFQAIFMCNICGMLPFIARILQHGPSSAVMNSIMGTALNWFIIYGAAMIGLWLVAICPMIAQIWITRYNIAQIHRLERLQKKIESEWGHEVTQLSEKRLPKTDDE